MVHPAVRKGLLTVHVLASVGWLGALLAFLALEVATVASEDPAHVRAAYVGMDLVTRWAILPLALAAFATGIAIALATPWGLARHYWVLTSLVLTAVALLVLMVQVPTVQHRAQHAADATTTDAELAGLGSLLLHSVGGTLVLTGVLALNVVKPKGLTPYGWRRQRDEAAHGKPRPEPPG